MSDEIRCKDMSGKDPTACGDTDILCGNHIVQYTSEYSLCTGCVTCQIMCGLSHEGYTGRTNSRIQIDLDAHSLIQRAMPCMQCADHPCYEACPKKDEAMCIDPKTGVVYVNEDKCIGCSKCQKSCRFTPSRIQMKRSKNRKEWKAVKCDLCRGNTDGPQCIKWCPVRCIGLSDDSEMTSDGLRPIVREADGKGEEHA